MDESLRKFRGNCNAALLRERVSAGHWVGELSTSALSTATAVVALHCVDASRHRPMIGDGVKWLVKNQNEDGGWGDTTRSFSNISTTLLVWSTLHRCGSGEVGAIERAGYWIRDYVGSLSPDAIAEVVKARYGKDRTFSVPILMLCAICGTLGKRGWSKVLPLPYEMAACPREWFAAMKLPVVSYALPALIAIGRARYEKHPPLVINPAFWVRRLAWPRVSRLLHEIQPASGGFLEAAPLTSFVTMALASVGKSDHPAAVAGVRFLTENVQADGSWPIDTNLATWATTLAVKSGVKDFDKKAVLKWLLDQQYQTVHPFTNSAPGAWAWTDLTGGVPDADDTPGAMLALRELMDSESAATCREAAEKAAVWLLDLQNNDGGIPTFCKGWGALPFDRSSPDLTAHTLRAWAAWRSEFDEKLQERIEAGTLAGLEYLRKVQQPDGSWIPLWFGNQHLKRDEENPTYGTVMVCRALEYISPRSEAVDTMLESGLSWLGENQNKDGGWGGGLRTPSSIEETSLAISALANAERFCGQVDRGIGWLQEATRNGTEFPASPIGFYFAKLWYFEKIYPMVWTLEALTRVTDAKNPGR